MRPQHLTCARRRCELRRILLARLPDQAHLNRAAIEAIDLFLSFEAWQRLRGDQGLSVARAKDVLQLALDAVLAAKAS